MQKIIFDGSILTNIYEKNSSRSGIFFVAWNIFFELLKKNVEVYLYFSDIVYAEGVRFRNEFCKNVETIDDIDGFSFFVTLKFCLCKIYSKISKRKIVRKPVRFLIILTNSILKICTRVKKNRSILCRADVFFSPVFAFPKIIKRNVKLRKFLIIHDCIPLVLPEYFSDGRALFWNDIKESGNERDFFFFVSQNSQKDAQKYLPFINERNSKVAYLAANSNFAPDKDFSKLERLKNKYKIPQNKRYVFSLCSLEPRKNLVRSVRSFIEFLKRNEISDLIFILGGGSWDSFIDLFNEKLGDYKNFSDRFILLGYVDDEDLSVLYSNAEWFVYTSQYEGFGLPPLEAMQCGCPVIVSNNSSLPEVVGDAGLLIDWDSDEQHIAAYEKYYFDENLRKENSKKGLEQAKLFSWKKTVNQILRLME